MVEKKESVMSIGFGSESDTKDDIVVTVRPLPYGQYIYNICVFVIKCEHNKMPLYLVKDNSAVWLPYVAVSPGNKWINSNQLIEDQFIKEKVIDSDMRILVPKGFIESMRFVSISRLQLPSDEFISRMVFCAKWKSVGNIICCENTTHYEWHSIDDIINKKYDKLWGKEVSELAEVLKKSDEELKRLLIPTKELTNDYIYKYANYSTKGGKKLHKMIAESLEATEIDRKVMEKLYSNFVQHCYPSFYMSFIAYKQYMTRIELRNVDEKSITRAFIAMNYDSPGFLSFHEFLLGLLVLEPNSPQSPLRNAYIFRYYDNNTKKFLDRNDIKEIVIDLRKLQKKLSNNNNEDIEEEVDRMMKVLSDDKNSDNKITLDMFSTKIMAKELNISVLFRALESMHKLISDKNIYENIERNKRQSTIEQKKDCCPKHKIKDFQLAIHNIQVKRDARPFDPRDIRNTDGRDVSFTIDDKLCEIIRNHSIEVVNRYSSVPNVVIEVIREFGKFLRKTDISDQSKKDLRISATEKLKFEIIQQICGEIEQIFRNESRVLKVQSPMFVLGDIHGNLRDLLTFEEQLWVTAPHCLPSNLLFAGDFVDRGEYGIECVLYLYSMKLLNPNQVFLLRGNHEIRAVQRNFTFEKECNEKYKRNGQKVFELFNKTFDVLPIAAVIDETIFCAHGGIPYSIKTIEELMKVPVVLKEPEIESPAVWEILWSDPMNKEEYQQIIKFNKIKDDNGYVNNTKRSTAFYFSEKALNAFLSINKLSHVIRAHEVIDEGFKLFLNGRVITIFSSSNYCGLKNKAAAAWIDGKGKDGVIRIVKLVTT